MTCVEVKLHTFPTKLEGKRPSPPGLPAAVLYNGSWWWAIDEIKEDVFLCERHIGNETEQIKLHLDDMEELI